MLTQPHTFDLRVYYEDTDAGGVVYHSQYLNFMERARTEWLRALGVEQDDLRDQYNTLLVVRRVATDFLAPARFNQQLQVLSQLNKLSPVQVQLKQRIISIADPERKPLIKAEVQVVCINAETFKPQRLPQIIMERLNAR